MISNISLPKEEHDSNFDNKSTPSRYYSKEQEDIVQPSLPFFIRISFMNHKVKTLIKNKRYDDK